MTAPLLRVRGWAQRFENSRTRELRSLGWIPESTDLASDLYCAILDHPQGAAHYGVAVALHVVAAKSTPRGDLRREDGRPHDAQTLARVTRMPQKLIEEAIERLVEIGDLEILRHKTREIKGFAGRNVATLTPAAATARQDSAEIPPANRTERTESSSSNRKNETEGTEPHGTNCRQAAPDQKAAAPEIPPSSNQNSLKTDDDDPNRSLKAIFEANGETLTEETLMKIKEYLEVRQVGFPDYVAEAKLRLKPNGHIHSVPAIALALAKGFAGKTRPAKMPPKAPKRCPECHTIDVGRGLVLTEDGLSLKPCPKCAIPEFVADYTAREKERKAK